MLPVCSSWRYCSLNLVATVPGHLMTGPFAMLRLPRALLRLPAAEESAFQGRRLHSQDCSEQPNKPCLLMLSSAALRLSAIQGSAFRVCLAVQVGCAGMEVPRLGSSDRPSHQHPEGSHLGR